MRPKILDILENGYSKNFKTEQRFRSLIVDKLLEELGWDIFEDVDPEAEIPAGSTTLKVDYVVGVGDSKFAIEAKNPTVDIIKNQKIHQQLSSYLRLSREVSYGILYNGKNMLFMKKDSENPIVIWKAGGNVENIMLFSKSNFPRNIDDLLKLPESSNLLTFLSNNKERLINRFIGEISAETGFSSELIRKNVKIDISADQEVWSSADEPSDGINSRVTYKYRRKSVKLRRFSIAGRPYDERKAKQVLIKTAEWLISRGAITTKTKVVSGPSRYIINSVPNHPDGSPFVNLEYLSNGMCLETNNSHDVQEKYARRLLTNFGYDENLIEVEWEHSQ